MKGLSKDKGLSLVEVLVALAIFGVLFGGLISMMTQENRLVKTSAEALKARLIATKVMETLKAYPFENLEDYSFARISEPKNMAINVFVSDFDAATLKRIYVEVRWLDPQGRKKYFKLSTLRAKYALKDAEGPALHSIEGGGGS